MHFTHLICKASLHILAKRYNFMFTKIRVMGQVHFYITEDICKGGLHIPTKRYNFMFTTMRVMGHLSCYITQDLQGRFGYSHEDKLGIIRGLQWVS